MVDWQCLSYPFGSDWLILTESSAIVILRGSQGVQSFHRLSVLHYAVATWWHLITCFDSQQIPNYFDVFHILHPLLFFSFFPKHLRTLAFTQFLLNLFTVKIPWSDEHDWLVGVCLASAASLFDGLTTAGPLLNWTVHSAVCWVHIAEGLPIE